MEGKMLKRKLRRLYQDDGASELVYMLRLVVELEGSYVDIPIEKFSKRALTLALNKCMDESHKSHSYTKGDRWFQAARFISIEMKRREDGRRTVQKKCWDCFYTVIWHFEQVYKRVRKSWTLTGR